MEIGVNHGLCSDINNGFIKRIDSCSNCYAMDFKRFWEPTIRLYDLVMVMIYVKVLIVEFNFVYELNL